MFLINSASVFVGVCVGKSVDLKLGVKVAVHVDCSGVRVLVSSGQEGVRVGFNEVGVLLEGDTVGALVGCRDVGLLGGCAFVEILVAFDVKEE